MAVTLDTALGTGNASAASSVSFNTTAAVASGGRVVLICGRWQLASTSTMSITGTGGLTWAQDHTVSSGTLRISVFSAPAPAGLASGTTLTVSFSTASNDTIIGAGSFLGIDTVGTVVAFNGGAASTAAWSSASVAATSGNALIGGAFCDGLNATSTPTAPGVELFDRNIVGQSESLVEQYKLSVAGSDTIAGTWSGAVSHVAIGVAYKAAAAGAAAPRLLGSLGVGT